MKNYLMPTYSVLQIIREYQIAPVIAADALEQVVEHLRAIESDHVQGVEDEDTKQALIVVLTRTLLLMQTATNVLQRKWPSKFARAKSLQPISYFQPFSTTFY